MCKLFFSLSLALLQACSLWAQVKISNHPGNPHPAAQLDLESSNRGLLIPRVSQNQLLNIPADAQSRGLLVYNTDSSKLFMYDGNGWRSIGYSLAGAPWLLGGNAGTDAASHFIGTTDSADLVLRSHFQPRLVLKANGWLGLHTAEPSSVFTIRNVNRPFSQDDLLIENFAAGNGTPSYRIFSSRGNPSAPASLGAGDYLGGLVLGGRVNNQPEEMITGIYSFYTGFSNGLPQSNLYFLNAGHINLFLDQNGRAGLGTTNPAAGIELVNDNDPASRKAAFMSSSYSTVSWPEFVGYRARGSRSQPQNLFPADEVGALQFDGRIDGNQREVAGIRASFLGSGPGFYTGGRLTFTVGGTRESLVIDSSGMTGIGTRDPIGILDIVNDGKADPYDDLRISSYGPNSGPALLIYKSNGSSTVPQNLSPGNFLGILAFSGRVGGSDAALSQVQANYTGNGSTVASNLLFRTSGVTGMELDARGWLSVGTPNTTPGATLDVQGSLGLRVSAPDGAPLYSTLVNDLMIRVGSASQVNTVALGNGPEFNNHMILLRNDKAGGISLTTAGVLNCLNGTDCGTLPAGRSAGFIGIWQGGSMVWIQLF